MSISISGSSPMTSRRAPTASPFITRAVISTGTGQRRPVVSRRWIGLSLTGSRTASSATETGQQLAPHEQLREAAVQGEVPQVIVLGEARVARHVLLVGPHLPEREGLPARDDRGVAEHDD